MKLTCIYIILLLSVLQSYAQLDNDFHFKHIDSKSGLSSNQISDIVQDTTGYIWIATNNGLNLYDGNSISIFKKNNNASNSICSNNINDLVVDKKTNNIWIGTSLGLCYFDRENYSFVRMSDIIKDEPILNKNTSALFLDSKGNLWIERNKIYVIDIKNKTIEKTDFESVPMYEDENGLLYCQSKNSIITYNIHNKKKSVVADNIINGRLQSIYADNDKLWLSTSTDGLICLHKENKHTPKYFTKKTRHLASNRVEGLVKYTENQLLIANRDGGLVLLDMQTEKSQIIVPDIHNPHGINNKALTKIVTDTNGSIWIGTFNSGINFLDIKRKKIKHYSINFKEDGLFNNNIRCMFQDMEGKVWIGTKSGGGLSQFHKEKGTFTHYRAQQKAPGKLSNDFVLSINEIDKNNLLIATLNGLFVFNKTTQYFSAFYIDEKNSTPPSNSMYLIHKDNLGTIWIAGRERLYIFDPEKGSFNDKIILPKKNSEIKNIKALCNEDAESMWIGTRSGLFLYNIKQKEVIKHFDKGLNNANLFITALSKDSKNNLWIGSNTGGIHFKPKGKDEFTAYTVEQGLADDQIKSLLVDNHDNVWVASGKGISELNTKTKKIRNFDISDGLQDNIFEAFSCLKTNKGELLFGGRNGFNIFLPSEIKDNTTIPVVEITGLKIFNKTILPNNKTSPIKKHISLVDKITFTHKQSVIAFRFTAINYTSPEKTQFAYKMEGLEKDWHEVGNSRQATYSKLPAGEYVFRVKASNNDKYWNEIGKSIKVTVLPPWWEARWFRILMAVILIGTIVIIYKIRINLLEEQKKELEQKVNERTKDLQEANIILEESREEINQQNEQLEQKQKEVNTKNTVLEEQNINIKAGINYAKTIQNAILPSQDMINSALNSFIVFRAKDIVSGDFYWISKIDKHTYILAAVDCTGHGVPGAFMSIIGSRVLNTIVNEMKIHEPNDILLNMHKEIKKLLKQDIGDNDDGMDVCLCKIEKTEHPKVTYSGAKRPLFYYQAKKGKVTSIKGCINSIGGNYYMDEYPFTNTELQMEKGDIIYLTSDGYTDQNNSKRKNYGTKRFTNKMLEIADLSMKEQKNEVEKALNNHMEGVNQRDDITVIGVKF